MHVIVGDLTPKHVNLIFFVLFKCFIYYVGIVWKLSLLSDGFTKVQLSRMDSSL